MQYNGPVPIEQESVVVIYDTKTGAVIHRHHAITAKGGAHPDQKTLEHDAMEQLTLARPQIKAGETAILHVDPASLEARTLYKVDVTKRVLVKIEPPKK
ncbi:MAG TPA: hypothetical protein VLW48_02300 [Candidatus Bathyarchaeia archaeon]|nr:hypothetical protein [Candidatus Bathyarchaeia archaeon]